MRFPTNVYVLLLITANIDNCQQFAYAQTNHFTFVCQFTLQSDSMITVIAFLFFSYFLNRYALCFSLNLSLALVLSTRATFRLQQSELTWGFSLIDVEWKYIINDSTGTIHSIHLAFRWGTKNGNQIVKITRIDETNFQIQCAPV